MARLLGGCVRVGWGWGGGRWWLGGGVIDELPRLSAFFSKFRYEFGGRRGFGWGEGGQGSRERGKVEGRRLKERGMAGGARYMWEEQKL